MSTLKTTNIAHPSSASNNIVLDSSGNVVLQAGTAAAPALQPTGDTNTGVLFPAADTVAISTGGSERSRVDSSGRLLVGTSTGLINARLTVSGGDSDAGGTIEIRNGRTNPSGEIYTNHYIGGSEYRNNSNQGYASIACYAESNTSASNSAGRLVFATTASGTSSSTERMRITQAGRVGINETTPAGLLHISKSSGTNTYILCQPGSGDPNLYTRSDTVGTAYHLVFQNPNGSVGRIETSATSTSFVTSSDYRLKENVTAVNDGITRLQQLKPSRFNFITDPDKTVDGFIAHEVQAVVPEAISGEKDALDDEGNPIYQGIDQSKLVPLLTAALQEAIGEIESLKARVAALEAP